MVATPATLFATPMSQIVANLGGAVQSLPNANQVYGRQRTFVSILTLASQANGSVIGLARIPLLASLIGIQIVSSVSLGSSTIALGDAGSGNSAIYLAAQTFTSVNTPTRVGNAATHGQPITVGYDCVTGLVTQYQSSSGFGAGYEDIILTVGAANLPASGTLNINFEFMLD
jgi:hypothetical protein